MAPKSPSKPGVFLSHTHADKAFARRLAEDLKAGGARVWIDEAEIRVGDSLIGKIREGIDSMNFLAVILSPESVGSEWVNREVDIAMNQEIEGRRVKVLPLLLRSCPLPGFLQGKKYADFTHPESYQTSLAALLLALGIPPPPRELEPDQRVISKALRAQTSGDRRTYDPHGVVDTRLVRDLASEAQQLLVHAEDADSLISTAWDEATRPRRLRRLQAGAWEADLSSELSSAIWEAALTSLQEKGLLQNVANRPGYSAFKLTPTGWVLAGYSRR